MRGEKEIFGLIIKTAEEDERIFAVLLMGSRADPNAPADVYQDYDICYFAKDVAPFYNNMDWICEKFGKPAIVQLPESMRIVPPEGDGYCTFLMIFEDGVRIDLTVDSREYIDDGEPAVVLLDKCGFLPKLPPPDGNFWNIKPPTQKLFSDCCNEFWWCLNNTAKGIARNELPYAMEMYNTIVRGMLNKMVEWYIGVNTDFSVSAGKMGKYFIRYLPVEIYDLYVKTYSDGSYDNFWEAVYTMCLLFRTAALHVADKAGFSYNGEEETGMLNYMNMVKNNKLQ